MIRRIIIIITLCLPLAGLLAFGNYWINTQPIWLVDRKADDRFLTDVPARNKELIYFVEANGMRIAPNYQDVMCTEFIIKIIDEFIPLSQNEMNEIRILTPEDIGDLIDRESSVIKGVQSALVKSKKGTEITEFSEVIPGDFVQFWNVYHGKEYGHCGIVFEIDPNESLTLYSSHPLTDGFGIQKYMWPDKAYFVRLN